MWWFVIAVVVLFILGTLWEVRFGPHGTFTPEAPHDVREALIDVCEESGFWSTVRYAVEIRPMPDSWRCPKVRIKAKRMWVSRSGIRSDELRRRLADAGIGCTNVPQAVAAIGWIAFRGCAWASCSHPPNANARQLLDRALIAQQAMSDGPEPAQWRWRQIRQSSGGGA